MLKSILNLKGVEKLNKKQKIAVKGGKLKCWEDNECIQCSLHCAEFQCQIC